MTARPVREWAGYGALPEHSLDAPEHVPGHFHTRTIVVAFARRKRDRKLRRAVEVKITTSGEGRSYAFVEWIDYKTQRYQSAPALASLRRIEDLPAFFAMLAEPNSVTGSPTRYVYRVVDERIPERGELAS